MPGGLDDKGFWMARKRPLSGGLQRARVDLRQRTSVSEKQVVCRGIESEVVGVVDAEEACRRGRTDRVVGVDAATAPARDDEPVRSRQIGNALRLPETLDAGDALVRDQVNDLERTGTECGDEQPVALDIDGKVIEPSTDVGQLDASLQKERLRRDRRCK